MLPAGAHAPALRVAVENRTLRLAARGRWTVKEFARLDGEIKTLNVAALPSGFDQAMKDLVRWAASVKGRSGA
jgi:hypothetical protein